MVLVEGVGLVGDEVVRVLLTEQDICLMRAMHGPRGESEGGIYALRQARYVMPSQCSAERDGRSLQPTFSSDEVQCSDCSLVNALKGKISGLTMRMHWQIS